MFQTHATPRLAALVDGELSAVEIARVQRHLSGCAACSAALDGVRWSNAVLERLPLTEAPAAIWTSIERALDDEADESRGWWQPFVMWRAVAAVLLVAVAGLVAWQLTRGRAPHEVVRLDAPGGEAPMAIGEWIETGAASGARVRIGQIGTVDVGPNTRMQLLVARADEHRLNLAHGSISAVIAAPPRLFFVETPASTVVDLGCAYTMDVDQEGVGVLRVTSGWASLEWEGRESVVPAGASCPTRPNVGPGTPAFDDASERFKRALEEFDFAGGGAGTLPVILSEARSRDTLTLWHLLLRVEGSDRVRVFDRLVELTPLPAGVARDKALALDPATLTLWREELAWTW
jgi:Putative zinc-finger